MGKFVYTPMVVLALLIPWVQRAIPIEGSAVRTNCVSSIWRDPRLWICAAGNVLAFLWLFSWLKATSWFVNTPMIVSYDQMIERKTAMLSGPDGMMEVLRAVFSAIIHGRANLGRQTDGLAIMMFWALWMVVAVVLLAASVARAMPVRLLVFLWCAVAVSTGIMLLTYVALWLQYTPVGATVVDGMQHRYFFPLVILMLLCGLECLRGLWYRRRMR